MTCRLNVLYKCMKLCRNLSYSFQVIERTRFYDRQTDRQMQGGNITAFNLHNYEMLNKMSNSRYDYNVLDNHYHKTCLWYLGVS